MDPSATRTLTTDHDAATDPNPPTVADKLHDLCRNISVEAPLGSGALYASCSRSSSVSHAANEPGCPSGPGPSAGAVARRAGAVSFPAAVDEHENARSARAAAAAPSLPRIDSEKTLVAANDGESEREHSPARLKLQDSKGSWGSVGSRKSGGSELEHKLEIQIEEREEQSTNEPPAEEPAPQLSTTRKVFLGMVTMLNVLIGAMTGNAVVLTIPSMVADLGIGQLEAQWAASSYSLALACGLLFAGRLADIFGRKRLFLGGVSAALAFNLASGGVRSLIPLCVLRALCGLGMAVSTPSAFGIVGITFRAEPERTILFSILGLGNPVGASVGMLVGGGVSGASVHGWQYLYFVLGGLCVIPLVIGFFAIPNDHARAHKGPVDRRIDWLGGLLITAALCLFIFSITDSGISPTGWKTPYVPTLLAVSALLFAAFGWWEHRVEHHLSFPPIVKLSLFARHGGAVSIVLLCSFLPFVAVSGWVYSVSLFYQELKGMSPIGNAIHTLPASLCGVVAALAVMVIVPRVRAPFVFMAGGFLTGVACLLFIVEPKDTIYWACEFISMLCLPFGADLTTGIGSILMSNLCNDDEQSVAGALFQTATQVASALGISMTGLVVASVSQSTGDLRTALHHAFGMTVAFAWASVLIAGIFLRKMGLARNVGTPRGGGTH